MLIRHVFLGFLGIASGFAVSAGTFAFLIVIGVVPRMIGKCNRAAETMHFENAIILGGIMGNMAEILNTFPIMFRRSGLKEGLSWIMLVMALGKTAGALYYFLTGIG